MKNSSKRWREVKNQKKSSSQHVVEKKSLFKILKEIYAFRRIKAFITDIFMLYTPILYIVAYLVLGSASQFRHNQVGIFVCLCLYGVISAIFVATCSQTPGFRYMGLALVRSNGDKVGFFRALLRFFIWVFGVAVLFGVFTPFFRKDKKCLQDILCDTTIISKTP